MTLDMGTAGGAGITADGDRWTLVFIRDFRQPPSVVWAALTDPAQLDRWAPFRPARPLDETGDTTLTQVDGAEQTDHPATVRRAEAPMLLEYTWGDDLLRWELAAVGEGTRLTLRHTLTQPGVEAMVAAGWHICAEVLRRLLDGEPVGVIRGGEARRYGFDELREGYAKLLTT